MQIKPNLWAIFWLENKYCIYLTGILCANLLTAGGEAELGHLSVLLLAKEEGRGEVEGSFLAPLTPESRFPGLAWLGSQLLKE